MTHHQDDDDALDGIDLQMWRVPPPPALDRPALLARTLAPARAPKRRFRMAWMVAAIVLLNVAVTTLILIVLRPTQPQTVTAIQPAGGSVDAQVRQLLERLAREQRELEHKLTEIQELRALVLELSEKVRQLEQDGRRERTVPKQPERPATVRIAPPPADPLDTCDEVSCVLTNHKGGCCTKYRKPGAPMPAEDPVPSTLPDVLDRAAITEGMATVKARVKTCASRSSAKGIVKISVRVDGSGSVTNVVVKQSPDTALATCVADQVRRAVFPETQLGGSFGYPFVF